MNPNPAPTLNPALREFWQAPARNRVLYGGRSSSKSWDAAGVAIALAQWRPMRFLCTRQFQVRIEDSVYTLLKKQIHRFGLRKQFTITNRKIICDATGSEFIFYGLARNIEEIRGLEGIDVCWLEEAHLLTEKQWQILEPTLIRNMDYEFWVVFNPLLATDFVYRNFVLKPPPNTVVRKINYLENPFLNPQALDVIEHLRSVSEEDYRHFYLGEPLTDDDASIIKQSWIRAAIDAHLVLGIEPLGSKRLGFDIADSGADECALAHVQGWLIDDLESWKAGEDELLKSTTRAFNRAVMTDSEIIYDNIGVGASAGAKIKELNISRTNESREQHLAPFHQIRYTGFNAGGAVYKPDATYTLGKKNKDIFSNVKAQAWWLLADRFRNTYNAIKHGQVFPPDELISIASDLPQLEQLIIELSTVRKDIDMNGRLKVESKKDLAKRDVPSPNLADAVVLAFAPIQRAMIIRDD